MTLNIFTDGIRYVSADFKIKYDSRFPDYYNTMNTTDTIQHLNKRQYVDKQSVFEQTCWIL